jgi:hypothetical protein
MSTFSLWSNHDLESREAFNSSHASTLGQKKYSVMGLREPLVNTWSTAMPMVLSSQRKERECVRLASGAGAEEEVEIGGDDVVVVGESCVSAAKRAVWVLCLRWLWVDVRVNGEGMTLEVV